jgi:sulfate adenylyltransferase
MHSKIEPFGRAMESVGRKVLITGRRKDQGAVRVELPIWEGGKKTLNPMANWALGDVTAFVDAEGVPVNPAHNYVFRHSEWICPRQRHRTDLPWERTDLGKPYWRASKDELFGPNESHEHVWVFKSFGDVHTSVPVYEHESERAGRFVRSHSTECGLHTRATEPGAPHGGELQDLMVKDSAEREAIVARSKAPGAPRPIDLNERQLCDVELLISGGFSPLKGFMTQEEYDTVVDESRLPEQQVWGMPIVLDVASKAYKVGERVLLRGQDGVPVAELEVEDVWEADKVKEARKVFGTTSVEHPGVATLFAEKARFYLGGSIRGLALPKRSALATYKTPRDVRKELSLGEGGHSQKLAVFQCRNPIHKAHHALFARVLEDMPDIRVLVHPTCGPTQPGDIDPDTRIKTYQVLADDLAASKHGDRLVWGYLPYAMSMAGPREAIQHAIIRKNYGVTHFLVGRDMAGTKSTLTGEDFYGPYDAQKALEGAATELGLTIVKSENVVFTDEAGYVPESEAKDRGLKPYKLSGTEFRRRLRAGEAIPEWFAFPSVVSVLRDDVVGHDGASASESDVEAEKVRIRERA